MNAHTGFNTQSRNAVPRVDETNGRFSRPYHGLLASLGVAFLLVSAPAQAVVAVAPTLGVAQQFAILGNSGVTGSTGDGTTVSGDVGSGPTTYAISNFPPSSTVTPFIVHPTDDAITDQANADANAAYNSLASQGVGTALGNNLSGLTLNPGVYSSGAADLGASSTLTLNDPSSNHSGIFVFNIASTLTMNGSSTVTGTANPCNVYWRVGSSATLNGLAFMGNIIADTSITVASTGNVSGRVLAGAVTTTGVVTMPGSGGNTIGGCSLNAPPLLLGAVPPTVSKRLTPARINMGGTSTLTITLSNSSTDTADTITSLTDNLPGGMVIAPTPNAGTTCSGGSFSPSPSSGDTSVSLTEGTIPTATLSANSIGTCTVSVDVTAAATGSYINTVIQGGLVTDNGNNAAPASATSNVVSVTATHGIPTLSEWAMIMLTALLAIAGLAAMRRRQASIAKT